MQKTTNQATTSIKAAVHFDTISMDIERVSALLQLLDEHLENEISNLKEHAAEHWAIECFVRRNTMADALLCSISGELSEIRKAAEAYSIQEASITAGGESK